MFKLVEFDLSGYRMVGEVIRHNKHTVLVLFLRGGKDHRIKRHLTKHNVVFLED